MTERPSYTINFLLQRLVGCLHFTVCLLCSFMPFCMCVPVVLWYAALTEFLAAGFEKQWFPLRHFTAVWLQMTNTGAEINFIKHTVVFRCTREDQCQLYLRLVYPDHWERPHQTNMPHQILTQQVKIQLRSHPHNLTCHGLTAFFKMFCYWFC